MLVVLDTTVVFQALYSQEGASYFILSLVRSQKVKVALSQKVYAEYEAVLRRKKNLKLMGLNEGDIENFLSFLAFIGRPFETYFLFRPNLKDEDDNMLVELAVASNASYLITSNIKDFKRNAQLKFAEFAVITPTEFVKMWRTENEE